jgi:solute carrier family 25 protein 16
MIPYAGLSFSSFERLKHYVLTKKIEYLVVEHVKPTSFEKACEPASKDRYYELTVPGKLVCGGLTAVIAQTITYPLDVVRRHMQLVTMLTDSVTRQ